MNTESKCHRLYWQCNQTGKKLPAGVAFFNENKGDYRLKVDTFPEDKAVFLKPVSVSDQIINFRVETAVRKNGVVTHRAEIGVGHANVKDGYPIFMNIGPFDRFLVLESAA